MIMQPVSFVSAQGHSLTGRLIRPFGPVRAIALFAHCFTCTMQSRAAVGISTALARRGIATMRFNFTGLGSSAGDFGMAGFASDVADLIAAAQFLDETIGAPSLLIGHSLGGAAVLAAAGSIASAKAVATIGAPADVAHVLHNIKGDLAAIAETGHGLVTIGGAEYPLAAPFLDAARNFDLLAAVAKLRIPLLFAHAPRDEIVGIENAKSLFEAALHPKTFLSLDDADHLLTKAEDIEYVAAMVASWADRYLPPAADKLELPPGHVLANNMAGGLAVYLDAGTHHLLADEPVVIGGQNAGPTPYDLLLSALGACTAMTIRIVAKRENMPLEDVSITLSHQRDHHQDCDHCDEGSSHIQAIHRVISLTGDLTDAQRARLLGVAAKCPVHRTVTGTLHIHDRAEEMR